MRVKSVMEELSGEKIDIISNTNNIKEIIAKALTPAEVERVEIDEENGVANVFIKQEQRAKAVGKGGVNVNLAADLVGYKISLQEID
jgi:N utilization substance protein A